MSDNVLISSLYPSSRLLRRPLRLSTDRAISLHLLRFGGVEVAVTVVAAAGGCAITVFSVRVRLTGLASIVTFAVRVACSSLNRVVATSGSASSIASSAFSTVGKRPLSIRTHIFRMLLIIRSFCVASFSRSPHCLQASATTLSARRNGSSTHA